MLMMRETGNMDQVRSALSGITGVTLSPDRHDGLDWYMITVRTNHELDGVDGLRRHGLRAYWPSYLRTVPSRRLIAGRQARRSIRIGIIPYILSPKDPEIDISGRMERITGVIDLVRTYSGNPLVLRERDVQILRRIDTTMNTPKPEASPHSFKLGEKVRFVEDQSAIWPPGRIIKLAREGRITVEVDLMGRKVPITLFPHQIERM